MNFWLGLGLVIVGVALLVWVVRAAITMVKKGIEASRQMEKECLQETKRNHKTRVKALFRTVEVVLLENGINFTFDSIYRNGCLPTLKGKSAPLPSGVYLCIEPEDKWGDSGRDKWNSLHFSLRHPTDFATGSAKYKTHFLIRDAIFAKILDDLVFSIEEIEGKGLEVFAQQVCLEWLLQYEMLWGVAAPRARHLTLCHEALNDINVRAEAFKGSIVKKFELALGRHAASAS